MMDVDLAESLEDNETKDNESKEEWVIQERASFNRSAVPNLDVSLVDNQSFENGTGFVNCWIPPPPDQTKGQTQNWHPQNFEKGLRYVDTVLCQ